MSIKIRIEGLEELRRAFTNLEADFDVAIAEALEDGALKVRTEVIKAIQSGPASGAVYEKYAPRRTHQASAPGQPPMTDTGRLASSVYFEPDANGATVGSRLVYAHYLEFGTSRMAPRPVWLPAAERLRAELPAMIEAALRRAM